MLLIYKNFYVKTNTHCIFQSWLSVTKAFFKKKPGYFYAKFANKKKSKYVFIEDETKIKIGFRCYHSNLWSVYNYIHLKSDLSIETSIFRTSGLFRARSSFIKRACKINQSELLLNNCSFSVSKYIYNVLFHMRSAGAESCFYLIFLKCMFWRADTILLWMPTWISCCCRISKH